MIIFFILTNHRKRSEAVFTNFASYAYIEDDHVPFQQKKVPILHLIPCMFYLVIINFIRSFSNSLAQVHG